MKKRTKLILLFLITLLFQNCQKPELNFNGSSNLSLELEDQIFQSEQFGAATTGNFIGSITDERGNSLSDVQITIGNVVTTTDRNGVFIMNNANVFENFAYIKAQKMGYMDGSRVVIPKENGVNHIQIALFKKEVTAVINTLGPSEVSLPNGAKVSFNGKFFKADGSEYNGQVDVVLNYIVPNRSNTFTAMPGSLFAQTASNSARSLETYGMMSVNLFSNDGEPLNINEENPAIIEFPVDYFQRDIAPDTIDLWYFDEEVGYWKEEGQATREGDKYIAEVTHFTWWNCDIPFDSVNLCFSLSPTNVQAELLYLVVIKRSSSNQNIFSGIVSTNGFECGSIPADEEIEVYIFNNEDSCNFSLVYQEVLGGYSNDTALDFNFTDTTITTNTAVNTTINGTVTSCNGNPLTSGYMYIDNLNVIPITDGIINVSIQNCQVNTVNLQIFDFLANEWTIIRDVNLNGGTIDVGALSTCDNTGGIYNGDAVLSSQQEVDDFGAFEHQVVNGSLTISDGQPSDITNLSALSTIKIVVEDLNIYSSQNLVNLQGLNNIETTGRLNISYSSLTSLEGLEGLVSTRVITLSNNNSLESISSLENLSELSQLFVHDNLLITTLVGLEQITAIDYIWIYNNDGLLDLNGLDNVVSVSQNAIFPAIFIGLRPTDIPSHNIPSPNPNLSDFCALQNLLVNGNGVAAEIFIANNAYNPSVSDIIAGNCN
jgi:hypothetical protein